jgi:mono/diheme cytochrome c family protein
MIPKVLGGLAALFVLIHLVPVGRNHQNPAARSEPVWDSTQTRDLARRACFDCHSNDTRWPWYSSVAPASWQIQNHVNEGREALNFNTWPSGGEEPEEAGKEASEELREGKMPPWDYLLMHPEARLTTAERDALARGLETTLALARTENSGYRRERHAREDEEKEDGRIRTTRRSSE